MLNSPVIETILSLVMIILVFSVLVTCVQEGYATLKKSRGKMLEYAIGEILNDTRNKNFAHLLYQHPQIDMLREKQGDLPSYIDKETFARALIDTVAQECMETVYTESADKKTMVATEQLNARSQQILAAMPANSAMANAAPAAGNNTPVNAASLNLMQRFELGMQTMNNSELKKMLHTFHLDALSASLNNVVKDAEALKQHIENWYEGYMNRVTGWYKRKVRSNIFFASVVVTLVFNLNLISLSKTTYADSKLRGVLTSLAIKTSGDPNALANLRNQLIKDSGSSLNQADVNAVIGVELPIGWKITAADSATAAKNGWFARTKNNILQVLHQVTFQNVAGWLLMIMVLSLGAPFWFDILKKLVNVRNAGAAAISKLKS
jgi:hypothetical protein